MNDTEQEYMNAKENSQMRGSAASVGLSMAADSKKRTVHNEDFLNELRKADVDGEKSELEEEFSDWFSGAHAVTNRGDDWHQMADLIMMNKRERALAERRPGRLLRTRPFLRATMQGADSPGLEAYTEPDIPGGRRYWSKQLAEAVGDDMVDFETATKAATSKQQSQIYGAAEVAADLMALSRNGAGLESVSTVKTETNVRRQEQEKSTKERISERIYG